MMRGFNIRVNTTENKCDPRKTRTTCHEWDTSIHIGATVTSQEGWGGRDIHCCCALPMLRNNGILVRLATCQRLTNSLPKLNFITLSSPETGAYQVGRMYGRTCQLSKPFHSLEYHMESILQVRRGKNLKSLLLWMVGIDPTTQKPMACRRRYLLRKLVG